RRLLQPARLTSRPVLPERPGVRRTRDALVRLLVVRRAAGDARDDRLLRALVEPLPPALHGGQELVQVDLERREDAIGPVLHLEPRLARLATGFVDDVLRLVLGDLDDLGL